MRTPGPVEALTGSLDSPVPTAQAAGDDQQIAARMCGPEAIKRPPGLLKTPFGSVECPGADQRQLPKAGGLGLRGQVRGGVAEGVTQLGIAHDADPGVAGWHPLSVAPAYDIGAAPEGQFRTPGAVPIASARCGLVWEPAPRVERRRRRGAAPAGPGGAPADELRPNGGEDRVHARHPISSVSYTFTDANDQSDL